MVSGNDGGPRFSRSAAAGESLLRLTAIDIRDFRIVPRAAIEPGAVNWLFGANGAGKTSILEAIHLLGTGRSFVPGRGSRLIRTGAGPLRVVARLEEDGGHRHRMGLERNAGGRLLMRLDGSWVERIADLAERLPVVAIHPGSHEILAGGPEQRRRLLDWGLFHVEHGYLAVWQRYRRVLAQRNALLRSRAGARSLEPWDGEFAASGELVDQARRDYVAALEPHVRSASGELLRAGGEVRVRYRSGWTAGTPLRTALEERRARDVDQLTTTVGPHRGELLVTLDGHEARHRVSRGQQKLLVYVLRLAQARLHRERKGGGPVMLLDDLGAELDTDHRERVLATALETGSQLFVTAVSPDTPDVPASTAINWFHVEQGTVSEVLQ